MTDTVFEYFDLPAGPGVAAWPPGVPLPSPWFGSETLPQLICDLCDHWCDELWPLSAYPPVNLDDGTAGVDNAGDLYVCRHCAEAVRPPARSLPALEVGAEV